MRHDLAGRGDDVVGRAALIVERFDRRHETGVEEQVVEPHAGAVDRGGKLRNIHVAPPVMAEPAGFGRTGYLPPQIVGATGVAAQP